ncbi:unnamed protein product [Rotaria sordida]|uniref:MCM AAA-lid domain-containing protein n=1 Tax=Rotaria sordida TaxID=392033 RepID=A0A815KYU9_9BILA|nr:unnamed protein product [Rotaria sordida]CAF3884615.1 unnamed protein product [Rotaria sordida]
MDTDLLRDYISYARTFVSPQLTGLAGKLLVSLYAEMRKVGSDKEQISAYPRQLESLIRLAEAHAKVQLSDKTVDPKTNCVDVAILTTGISASERRLRADLVQKLEYHLEERKSTQSTEAIKKDTLFNEIRQRIHQIGSVYRLPMNGKKIREQVNASKISQTDISLEQDVFAELSAKANSSTIMHQFKSIISNK